MMRTHLEPPLRVELRELLELSVQPLNLYGTLLRRFNALEPAEALAKLFDPVTDGLRSSLQGILPTLNGPYLDLPSRAALCNLLSQTTQEEETCLGVALLEHFALGLEPYLRAAELDPDQAHYLRPLLGARHLQARPVEALIEARRAERQSTSQQTAASSLPDRRLADGG